MYGLAGYLCTRNKALMNLEKEQFLQGSSVWWYVSCTIDLVVLDPEVVTMVQACNMI